MSRPIIIAIYYVVLVLAIGLSSYFSYQGFFPTLEKHYLTAPFVMIIALGLFAAGALVQIGRDRKSFKEQLLAVLMFAVFAVFSTSSNFTYLYTNIRADIEREAAINEERRTFESVVSALLSQTKIAVNDHESDLTNMAKWYGQEVAEDLAKQLEELNNVNEYTEFVRTVNALDAELENMLTQSQDPGKPGCGAICRGHYRVVNEYVTELTGTQPTDLTVPRDISEFEEFFFEYQRRLWQNVCNAQSDLVAIYVLSEGNAPTSQCEDPDHLKATALTEIIGNLDDYSVEGVGEFLDNIDVTISRINSVLSTKTEVQLDVIEATVDAAATEYASVVESDVFSSGYSAELANQREDLLRTLEDAVQNIRPNEAGLFSNAACSSEATQIEPRDCLVLMKNELNQLTGDFSNVFPTEDIPDHNIDVENGQVGTIKDTLFNGLIERPSLPTTVFALFMGLMIDILPLMFAFVAFQGHVKEPEIDDPWGEGIA